MYILFIILIIIIMEKNCQKTKDLYISLFVRKYRRKKGYGLKRKSTSGGYRFAMTWTTIVDVGREWH